LIDKVKHLSTGDLVRTRNVIEVMEHA